MPQIEQLLKLACIFLYYVVKYFKLNLSSCDKSDLFNYPKKSPKAPTYPALND